MPSLGDEYPVHRLRGRAPFLPKPSTWNARKSSTPPARRLRFNGPSLTRRVASAAAYARTSARCTISARSGSPRSENPGQIETTCSCAAAKSRSNPVRPRHARSFAERSGEAEILGGVLEHVARVALAQAVGQQAGEQEREQRGRTQAFLLTVFPSLTEMDFPPTARRARLSPGSCGRNRGTARTRRWPRS